jgi:large subunit ribosomal protein L19
MNIMEKLARRNAAKNLPDFRPGDTVRVHVKIREGDKERLQVFEGVVIRRSRANSTFTVRKTSYGVGVERIFPLNAPAVDHVEIAARGKVRRSRLYYLRELKGKKARIEQRSREEMAAGEVVDEAAEQPAAADEPSPAANG